ncbi:HIRAN domain-containing protein [Clostridium massiliamazoniense]|uniref:HIRAN domain-containing protein n=1 Tax=Clostridium massiliamazoniense TaxID=1347366 RepID=UPI0006D79B04|nr:HIRAN domain-containing protein [Clostridium massiliamazoniense]
MGIVSSIIKNIAKIIAVTGKIVIILIGKTVITLTKNDNSKSSSSEHSYKNLAKIFENITIEAGDFTGNIIDKIISSISSNFSSYKFKNIHSEMEETLNKDKDPYLKKCKVGETLRLEHEKFSLYKPNSIAVYKGLEHLGYLNEESSKILIPLFNEGYTFKGKIEKVIKGKKGRGYNLKILVSQLSEPTKK